MKDNRASLKDRDKAWYFLLMLLGLTLLAGACGGGGGPQQHTFNILIKDGKPVDGSTTFRVKQDDTVTFNISSDTGGEAHLHGYDLVKEMAPGETVAISFTANVTGRFLIQIEETEVELGYLEVNPR
ncbi:MAG: hypothetical protein HY533_00310 [Chloroflexi bacterium]|nr:hypothetical protein [Chloroflexota bacterium]